MAELTEAMVAALAGIDAIPAGQTIQRTEDGVGGSPGGAGGISSPLVLSGALGSDGNTIVCDLWIDASDADTITESGGAVSQVDDKSGAGHHATQGTAENKPTTGAQTIGGLNTLGFDGTSNFLDTTALAYPGAALGPGSLAGVANFVTAIVYQPGAVDLDSFNYALVGDDSMGQYLQLNNSADEPQLQGSNPVLATVPSGAHVAVWISQAFGAVGLEGAECVRCDDASASVVDAAVTKSGVATLRIGATDEGGPSRFWLGKIGEIVHLSGRLDSYQVQQLVDYLTRKWGIS